jgi:hypothetical protein
VLRGVVTVSAQASDPDGSVRKVRFVLPDGRAEDVNSAPFTIRWNTSQSFRNGPGTVLAMAFDDKGAVGPVSTVSVTVNNPANQPPSVRVSAPQPNAVLTGRVAFSAEAADPDGVVAKVVFELLNGTSLEASAPPWTVNVDTTALFEGPQSVFVSAFDDKGARSDVVEVPIVVKNAR